MPEENYGHISVCLIFVYLHESAVFLLSGVETPFLQIHTQMYFCLFGFGEFFEAVENNTKGFVNALFAPVHISWFWGEILQCFGTCVFFVSFEGKKLFCFLIATSTVYFFPL